MAKMKVGIIGSGGRAVLHLKALLPLKDDFEICGMRFRTQEKADRFQRLLDTQFEIAQAKAQVYVGTLQTVLVEGRSKTDAGKLTGRTQQNRLVHFVGEDSLIGTEAKVRITRADPHAMFGDLV